MSLVPCSASPLSSESLIETTPLAQLELDDIKKDDDAILLLSFTILLQVTQFVGQCIWGEPERAPHRA